LCNVLLSDTRNILKGRGFIVIGGGIMILKSEGFARLIWIILKNIGLSMTTALFVLTAPEFAHADAVVTLCQSDNQTGPGMNLQQALAQIIPITQVNTITFQCNGPATIQIANSLIINQSTLIDGGNMVILDGGGTHSMFVAGQNSATSLFLSNLTLRNAAIICPPPGPCWGSVSVGLSLQIKHSRIENSGAAIYVTAGNTLGVIDTQFLASSVISAGTTTNISLSAFQGGGAILATGNVSISSSTFSGLDVSHFETCQQITIDGSTFQNNTAGALRIGCDSKISHSVFSNNVGTSGGAIYFSSKATNISLRAVKFFNNSASGAGGAVAFEYPANSTRSVDISYSIFTGNKATSGGAIAVLGSSAPGRNSNVTSITGRFVNFSHNVAANGGGAIEGLATRLAFARGAFADNVAGQFGGAIAIANLPHIHSEFANTLFVRNKALSGSAFAGDDADFINSTIDSNKGLAIAISAPRTPVHIGFKNSIISNNPQGGCVPTAFFDDRSPGHNLQFPGNDCGPTLKVANPHLDTMYIPVPTSPPIGNGDLNICMSPPINGRDVYGMGRPSGGACTIGAAEGDIQVLANRRTPKGRGGTCDCGSTLVKQLRRYLQSIL
jgi:predicted outer membrane repeat protein